MPASDPLLTTGSRGQWSCYVDSPGTQAAGAWISIDEKSGSGAADLAMVTGTSTVLTGYMGQSGATDVAELSGTDLLRSWLFGSGVGTTTLNGTILMKKPWDLDSLNQDHVGFVLRHGGNGTGGGNVNTLSMRVGAGNVAQLKFRTTDFGPTWTLPIAGTGSKDSWLELAVRWESDATSKTWRVVMFGDRDDGNGIVVYANETFTESTTPSLDRIDDPPSDDDVNAIAGVRPEFGSIGYWDIPLSDAWFEAAIVADVAELGVDVSYLFNPPAPDPIDPPIPRWTRAQLRRDRAIWLLEMTVGGREFLFAEEPVTVTDTRGRVRVYQEGLASLVAGVAAQGTPERSIGLTVDVGSDWPALVNPRRPVERSRARLLRWPRGAVYEQARLVLGGVVDGFAHGDRLEPVTFSLTRTLLGDSRPLPSPRGAVDSTTWPVRAGYTTDPAAVGQVGPLVIGHPGSASVWASPALIVEADHVSTDPRIKIADGRVAASSVLLWDVTDEEAVESASLAVSVSQDGAGRDVSVVDVAAELATQPVSGRKLAVSWTSGGGVRDPATGLELRAAGDVIAWLVRTWTSQPFDDLAFAAAREALNAYQIDAFMDDPISPSELLASIAAMLPVTPRQGERGLWYSVRRTEIRPEEAVAHLSADRLEIQRDGPIEVVGDDIVNEVAVEYAPAGSSSRYTRRVIVTGEDRADEIDPSDLGTDDARVQRAYRATLSQRAFGVRAVVVQLPLVWDASTASRVALDVLAQQAMPRRFAAYQGGRDLEYLQPDDVVLVTDSGVLLDAEPALVLDVEVGGPTVGLQLMFFDDPVLRS